MATTAALGVGGVAAVLGAADQVLFRPIAVDEGHRVVALYGFDTRNGRYASTSYVDYLDVAQRTTTIEHVSAYLRLPFRVTGHDGVRRIGGEAVTATYFEMLRVVPRLGTVLGEARADAWPMVATISERLWRSRFAGDPAVIGQTITAEGHTLTIVGVAPDTFSSPNLGWGARPDIWVPMEAVETLLPPFREAGVFTERGIPSVLMIGRLAAGVPLARAQAEVDVIARTIAAASPETNADLGVRLLESGRAQFWPAYRDTVIRSFGALGLAALLLLGLTFANLTTLLTQQVLSRRSEIGVRLALGATRGGLIRQVVAEAGVLGLASAVLSIGVASGVQHLLMASPGVLGIGLSLDLGLDGRVVGTCVLLSFGATLLAAALPFAAVVRRRIVGEIGTGQRTVTTPMTWARHALVGGQIAASAVLVASALVVAGSAVNAARVDLGFSTADLLVVSLDTTSSQAPQEDVRDALSPTRSALADLPGVTSVALSSRAPFDPVAGVATVSIPTDGGASTSVRVQQVTGNYFSTLDIPLRQGRTFTVTDEAQRLPVAIVSEALARRLWPDGGGVGTRLLIQQGPGDPETLEVVGVAADARYGQVWDTDGATLYTTRWSPTTVPHVLVKAPGALEAIAMRVPGTLSLLPASVSLARVERGTDRVEAALAPFHAASRLFSALAVLAVLVAMVGMYATLAYLVEQRTREIALRLALGGRTVRVAMTAVRGPVAVACGAVAAGLWGATAMAPLLAGQTRGLAWDGWAVLVATAGLVIGGCLVSAIVPARRATRVSPMIVLREG